MKKIEIIILWLVSITLYGNATTLQYDGWNLIGVCQDINRTDIDMTGIYEIQDQNGSSIYTGTNAQFTNLHLLKAGYGYWVKGDGDINFESGETTKRLVQPLRRDNWNLMASCEDVAQVDINMTGITELQSQKGEILYTGDWAKHSTLHNTVNGYGYWVQGNKETLWMAKSGPAISPTLADSTFTIAEDTVSGSTIGILNIVSEGDDDISAIVLSGTGSELFTVTVDGTLTLTSNAVLDYETTEVYTLTAVATNGAGDSNSVNVTINITNVIDNVPVLATPSSSSVAEDIAVGTEVVTITTNGSNGDENQVDSYTIIDGNVDAHFTISDVGVISIAKALDYEYKTGYTLKVVATNSAGESTPIDVVINVEDILDLPVGFAYQTINSANDVVETTTVDGYTIRLFTNYQATNDPQSNHVGIIVNVNGVDAPLLSIQRSYIGYEMVVGVYDSKGNLVGVSEIVILDDRTVMNVITEEETNTEDTTPPEKPILLTTIPDVTQEDSISIQISGEVGSKVYVDGEPTSTINSEGQVTIVLDTIQAGEHTYEITLQDDAGNESEGLILSIVKEVIEFLGGDGTVENPYQIATCQQLQNMENHLSSYFVLSNDIDCSNTVNWNDGAGFKPVSSFYGSFDGRNYTVSDLYINRLATDYVGLFGSLSGDVKNLKFTDVNISGISSRRGLGNFASEGVGVVAGRLTGTIKNVTAISGEVYASNIAGGLVGDMYGNDSVFIENSSSAVSVTVEFSDGSDYVHRVFVGGIVGKVNTGTCDSSIQAYISKSYSVGNVKMYVSNSTNVRLGAGGLAGTLVAGTCGGDIFDSYSLSNLEIVLDNVQTDYNGLQIGGLTSTIYTSTLHNSYAAGNIKYVINGTQPTIKAGGLVAHKYSSEIENCYWDINTTTLTTSNAGEGKTTAELQTPTSNSGIYSNWDPTVWSFGTSNEYPKLKTSESQYNFHESCTNNVGSSNAFYAGDGSESNPYQICSCEQLQNINTSVSSNYMLISDIDCSETINWNDNKGFKPIGDYDHNQYFRGDFNGYGHKIINLTINWSSYSGSSLFGATSGDVMIENFGLINPTVISSGIWTATIAGLLDGDIKNVYVINGSIQGSNSWSGGLVGQIHQGELSNSYYQGSYSLGGSWTGGLLGRVQDSATGMVSNSFVSASGFGSDHAHYAVVGISYGTLYNIYWNNLGSLNSNSDSPDSNDDITEIDNDESYFYNPLNEPMASWDQDIWEFSASSLPQLKPQN